MKLDATGHHWVVSLPNYNFTLSSKYGKANVDVDTFSCILWEKHDLHIEADMVWPLISNATQDTTLIEVYPALYRSLIT